MMMTPALPSTIKGKGRRYYFYALHETERPFNGYGEPFRVFYNAHIVAL